MAMCATVKLLTGMSKLDEIQSQHWRMSERKLRLKTTPFPSFHTSEPSFLQTEKWQIVSGVCKQIDKRVKKNAYIHSIHASPNATQRGSQKERMSRGLELLVTT